MNTIFVSRRKITWSLPLICITAFLHAQAPNPALIGYFHNWNDANAPYIELDQVDSRYNMITVSFAVPAAGTDYDMTFSPDQVSQSVFISQIQALHSQGTKVIISLGGATAPISLDNIAERDIFVSSMSTIINTYGFDGIDIDFEGSSISVSGGTIAVPTDVKLINLIDAINQIRANYLTQNGHNMILTMAPEAAFVQGGQSAYGGIWGAYLPVINALRDAIDILHVQLYNTGSLYGIDGSIYTQGTADFIVAMTEAVIQGFNTTGGIFNGLPANKVAIGLPSCALAAGGGYTDPQTVKSAVDYLRGNGPRPGNYILAQPSGYPDLRGMMDWSINWDAAAACGPAYEYASNFESIFGSPLKIAVQTTDSFSVYPNPTNGILQIAVTNSLTAENYTIINTIGSVVAQGKLNESATLDFSNFPTGIYFLNIGGSTKKIIKE